MRLWLERGRRGLQVVGALAVLAAAGAFILQGWLERRLESKLQEATGHRVRVGGVSFGTSGLLATDVHVFGAPPFEREPLARVDRLEVRWLRAGITLTPTEVSAEGVEVEYLGRGDVDNVGRSLQRATRGKPRVALGGLLVRVRRGRLRASLALPQGPRLTVRAREFSVDVSPEGDRSLALEGLVAEVGGRATAVVPTVLLKKEAGAEEMTFHGEEAALLVPAAGPLVDDLTIQGVWAAGLVELGLVREPGPAARPLPRLRGRARFDSWGGRLSVEAQDVALRPLRALLDRVGLRVEQARADLQLRATMAAGSRQAPLDVDLHLRARGFDMVNPTVDRRAWRDLTFEASGTASVRPAIGRVEVREGRIEMLGAKLAVSGWTELGQLPRGHWRVRTPERAPLPCAPLLAAQPAPVREALAGLELSGRLGGSLSITFDAAQWEALKLGVEVAPRCRVLAEPSALAVMLPTLEEGLPPPLGASGLPAAPAARLPLGPYHPDFAPLAKMPAHLADAFLTAEDGRFFLHDGFDLEMIRRALGHDLQMGTFAKGGSTITQQLAKNLFLSPHRTIARKLEETLFAWRLEERLDKKRMLELYLNAIELGPGIRGVKKAAATYFGREVSELRPLESAHLASLTPNPLGYARRFRDGHVDDGWLQRLYDLLGMMNRSRRLSRADLAAARAGVLTLLKI